MQGSQYRALFLEALDNEDIEKMLGVMDKVEAVKDDKELLESFFAADGEGCNILHGVIIKNIDALILVSSLLDLLRDNEALLKQVLSAKEKKFRYMPLDCVAEGQDDLTAVLEAKSATSATESKEDTEADRLFQKLSAHPIHQAYQTGRIVVTSSLEVQATAAPISTTEVGSASNEELAKQLALLLNAQRGAAVTMKGN